MLNDAKQRNDVLSQAYAALHAEYVSLKSTQLGDPTSSYHQPTTIDLTYGGGGPPNMTLPPGTGVDGLDGMDMFVYAAGPPPDLHPAYTF